MNRFVLAVLCCSLSLSVDDVQAGTILTGANRNRQSLRVVYTPDPDGDHPTGEMNIVVSTASQLASRVDRNLEVTLYISGWNDQSTAFTRQVILPQGSTSVSVKIAYNQLPAYGRWVIDVFEEGESIAQPKTVPNPISSNQSNRWLEIKTAGKSTRTFTDRMKGKIQEVIDDNASTELMFGLGESTAPLDVSTIPGVFEDSLLLANASTDWRTYLSFNAISMDYSLLPMASTDQLQAWSNYVLAGGNLLIYGAEMDSNESVDRLFAPVDRSANVNYRWNPTDQVPWMSYRSHGAGRILLCNSISWEIVEAAKRSLNYPVNNLAASGPADVRWFWQNLVQSVGKTQVWGFVLLIGLFVICVGPVTLTITSRQKHRTLLLFLIPAVALVTTALVLIYNLFRESWGTHGRVASIQYVDGQTGMGFTWSRQNYFSGSPPRNGLAYVKEALVKPIWIQLSNTNRNRDPRENVLAVISSEGASQTLLNWIQPRSQQSLLVGQPSQNISLPFVVSRDAAGGVLITSRIPQTIAAIILRESETTWYACDKLSPGETRQLTAQSATDIELQFKDWVHKVEPKAPVEVEEGNRLERYYTAIRSSFDAIDRAILADNLSKLDDYSFIALSQRLPEIELPLDRSFYDNEVHLDVMIGVSSW